MSKPWIGTLKAQEVAAWERLSIRPLGTVYGASVQGMAMIYTPITTSEVHVEVAAFDSMMGACLMSVNRQADELGANGIVDLVLTHEILTNEPTSNGYTLTSMKVVGTAVRDDGVIRKDRYLATVSAAELFSLRRAGYDPCGLAVGNTTYYQVAWRQRPKMTGKYGTWANEEITELTQGPYTAREIAMERMAESAKSSGGTGIVGIKMKSEIVPSGTLVGGNMGAMCRMTMIGTAIRSNPTLRNEVTVGLTVSLNE